MTDNYNHIITFKEAQILTELRDDKKFQKYANSIKPDMTIEMDINRTEVHTVELTEEIIQKKNQSYRQSKALLAQFYLKNGKTKIVSFSSFQIFKEAMRLIRIKLGYEVKRDIIFI